MTLTRRFLSCIDHMLQHWREDTGQTTGRGTVWSRTNDRIVLQFDFMVENIQTSNQEVLFKCILFQQRWVSELARSCLDRLGNITPRHKVGRTLQPTNKSHPAHTHTHTRSLLTFISHHNAPPHFFSRSSLRSKNSRVLLTDKRWREAAERGRPIITLQVESFLTAVQTHR